MSHWINLNLSQELTIAACMVWNWIPRWLHLAGNPFCLRVEATHQTWNYGQALFSQLIHCWYRQNYNCNFNPLLIKRLAGDFHVSMNKREHFHVNIKCHKSSSTTVENKPVWRTKKYSYGIMRQEWLKGIQSPNKKSFSPISSFSLKWNSRPIEISSIAQQCS